MSFFKKLKDRLFKSSSKIDEGLEAIVQEAADEAPAEQDRVEGQVQRDSIDSQKRDIEFIFSGTINQQKSIKS